MNVIRLLLNETGPHAVGEHGPICAEQAELMDLEAIGL